jgi:hypothetical protein
MSGGGKGGKTTTQVQIPKWLEDAARQNMARADELAKIGYTPYYGPDVAALTPQQLAAMQGTNDAASAFGFATADPMAGMPQAQTFANGVTGYSSAPMYEQSLAALQAARPGQFAAMQAPFIDPITGAQPGSPFGSGGLAGALGSGKGGGSNAAAFNAALRNGSNGDGFGGTRTGGGASFASSQLASMLPGGINTNNPSSFANTTAARLTSGTQTAPTSASRPAANPKR